MLERLSRFFGHLTETTMKKTLLASSFLALGALTFVAPAVAFADDGSTIVKSVDKDSDGTIDMQEAKTAAMANFAMADKDKDGTIDSKEAGMDVSKADPDKDGTLDKTEFASALDNTFKATDTDHDGTVDATELASPDGQKLQAMIK